MPTERPRSTRDGVEDAELGRLVVDDLRHADLKRDYLDKLNELYRFYLNDEDRARLSGMNRLQRALSLLVWIFKSLLLKLSPARRVMLLISFVVTLFGEFDLTLRDVADFDVDLRPWGFALLLVVLMLELRDKLLARDEIQIARRVQLALLPDHHPTIAGWSLWSHSQPANTVGGDLVDYLDIDDFRHGVLLGDVAGKGLGAALLTAKLQATLRALAPESVSLDELAARVNTILFRDGLDNRYATLFYAELQQSSGQLRYVNAGHNPPFLVRDGRLSTLEASSFPLGMLGGAEYAEGVVDLAPGDVLVIYSDGLSEAENADGDEFGAERLAALLRGVRAEEGAERIGRRLLEAAERFLDGARPGDDLSLMVLARTDQDSPAIRS